MEQSHQVLIAIADNVGNIVIFWPETHIRGELLDQEIPLQKHASNLYFTENMLCTPLRVLELVHEVIFTLVLSNR